MATIEKLKNPPITEALIDIRANLPSGIDLPVLATFHTEIKDRFPEKKERIIFEGGFQINAEGMTESLPSSQRITGYFFQSSDGGKIVQARLDGFTFNKLKPYEDWKMFQNEAKELWKYYLEVAKPTNITRIALRYINRIEIPLPCKDFKDYILTLPDVAPGVPQGLDHFLMRLSIPDPKTSSAAIITETTGQIDESGKSIPFIFDVDVFRQTILEPTSGEIWEVMDTLHELKNSIFFNSITDKTKELFQ